MVRPGLPAFIFHLLSRESKSLVDALFKNFPKITAAQIVRAENDNLVTIPRPWRAALVNHPKLLLSADALGSITRTSLLYQYIEALDWFSSPVLAAGADLWVAALNASDDLWGEQRDALESFILMLALITNDGNPQKGVELLFDSVHGRVLRDSLYGKAREILRSRLPELGWLSNWDIGLRLRLMVAKVYVRCGWSPQSFAALSKDPKTLLMLADAASDIAGGESLKKAISR